MKLGILRTYRITKRKLCINVLPWTVLILLMMSIIGILRYYEKYYGNESFQTFSYPSDHNFHEIIHSQALDRPKKLNTYAPRLISPVNHIRNVTAQVLVIVKSALDHFTHRAKIRRTWASELCQRSYNLSIYFALGTGVNDGVEERILTESQRHKDILRFNFVDSYENNTYKVMAIMRHFVHHHSHVPYLVIVDDDFFIDPSVLADTVTNQISRFEYDRYFGGYVWFHNMPHRFSASKWYMPREEYKFDFYPPYATGGFLLISSPMVHICDQLLPYLKYTPLDDVLLGILLFKLKIYPSHLKSVFTNSNLDTPEKLLAWHEGEENLGMLWEKRKCQQCC